MRRGTLITLIILAFKLSNTQNLYPDDYSIEFTDKPGIFRKVIDGDAISDQSFDPAGT